MVWVREVKHVTWDWICSSYKVQPWSSQCTLSGAWSHLVVIVVSCYHLDFDNDFMISWKNILGLSYVHVLVSVYIQWLETFSSDLNVSTLVMRTASQQL